MADCDGDATDNREVESDADATMLPYRIDLWEPANRDAVERVLARVADLQLARAIFERAQAEHPQRRITLRMGSEIIADTAR